MSELETRALSPEPTQLMVGAASPLWGFFAGAAASGIAFWWATRWAQPENLEALWGRRLASAVEGMSEETAVALKAFEPAIAAVEAVQEPVTELLPETQAAGEEVLAEIQTATEETLDATVEAAESLPEPILEAADAVEAFVEPVLEAAPEPASFAPAADLAPEPVVEAAAVEAPKPRRKPTLSVDPPLEPPAE